MADGAAVLSIGGTAVAVGLAVALGVGAVGALAVATARRRSVPRGDHVVVVTAAPPAPSLRGGMPALEPFASAAETRAFIGPSWTVPGMLVIRAGVSLLLVADFFFSPKGGVLAGLRAGHGCVGFLITLDVVFPGRSPSR